MPTLSIGQARKLVDHRLIVRKSLAYSKSGSETNREYILRAVSPSGKMAKYENPASHTFWCDLAEYEVLEDLGTVEATK